MPAIAKMIPQPWKARPWAAPTTYPFNQLNPPPIKPYKNPVKNHPWPDWWDFEIEFTPHLLKRMEDRNFSEVDLREMLHHAKSCKRDTVEGRWVIETRHKRHLWEVIVEPDEFAELLVIVTAYPVWSK